jgi:UDP-N-acetylglucosamine 2-epimerase (non-hydrolysing)
MKTISIIFGTRPEAIKLAPLIFALKKSDLFKCEVCITGQHKQLLDQVLKLFEIEPDYDLNIMKHDQTLSGLTSRLLIKIDSYLKKSKPDFVMVQGDTTTVLTASICAFYNKIPVGHIEAGLRTNDIYSPFPEELNRSLTSRIASFHFAPTEESKRNLIKENISKSSIFVVGNTVIDTLLYASKKVDLEKSCIPGLPSWLQYNQTNGKNIILITGHRREKFGEKMKSFCHSLVELASLNPKLNFIYPVHLNPNVQEPVNDIIRKSSLSNIFLIDPVEYFQFITLMRASRLIITDSGGIQEEACGLGIPVLLTRENTERPEAIRLKTVRIVGSDRHRLISEFNKIIKSNPDQSSDLIKDNPYGDGNSSERILKILEEKLR